MRLFPLLLGLIGANVYGQWIHYPTAGVPRTPNGTPDLAAACPRTADGKPDLSGLWINPSTHPPNPQFPGCAAISDEFVNIAVHLKGGLPYQPWAADLVKARSRAASERSNVALHPHRAGTLAHLERAEKTGRKLLGCSSS